VLEVNSQPVSDSSAEIRENLELIDHKIDVYRGRLAAGEADQLWAPDGRSAAQRPA